MKNFKILLFTGIIIFNSLFLSCKKDKISTGDVNTDKKLDSLINQASYIEYKPISFSENDTLYSIDQCIISRRPKLDSSYFEIFITGKYLGDIINSFPQATIKGYNKNDEALFEKTDFLSNMVNLKKIYGMEGDEFYFETNSNNFFNKTYPNFISNFFIDLNDYKNEFAFNYFDLAKIEIKFLKSSSFFTDTLYVSSINFEPYKIESNQISQKFKNTSKNKLIFNYETSVGFLFDEKGTIFDLIYGNVSPFKTYNSYDNGYFIFNNFYSNVKIGNIVVDFECEKDTTKSKSIQNPRLLEMQQEYIKHRDKEYQFYLNKKKI